MSGNEVEALANNMIRVIQMVQRLYFFEIGDATQVTYEEARAIADSEGRGLYICVGLDPGYVHVPTLEDFVRTKEQARPDEMIVFWAFTDSVSPPPRSTRFESPDHPEPRMFSIIDVDHHATLFREHLDLTVDPKHNFGV